MGKLLISKKAMRVLLRDLDVFPPFLEILHEFGERIERPSESRGSCQEQDVHGEPKSFGSLSPTLARYPLLDRLGSTRR